MMTETWQIIAEALGIDDDSQQCTETDFKWRQHDIRKNIQRWGTMDRRDNQGPTPYFGKRPMKQTQTMPPPIPAGGDQVGGNQSINPLTKPSLMNQPQQTNNISPVRPSPTAIPRPVPSRPRQNGMTPMRQTANQKEPDVYDDMELGPAGPGIRREEDEGIFY